MGGSGRLPAMTGLLLAFAATQGFAQTTVSAGSTAGIASGSALIADYPVFPPIQPPASYRAAVAKGTRSADGTPGEGYWQQRVNYRIDARLDPDSARLTGRETITYFNNSPDTLSRMVLHLYQNVLAKGARRNRAVTVTDGIQLKRVEVAGHELKALKQREFRRALARGSSGGYLVRGTLGYLALPDAIPSGDSVQLAIDWTVDIPGENAFRMGHVDDEMFTVAQWYPQIAVFDDVFGQDRSPYLGDGEFYLEYGSFDVDLHVPEGWLVSATGELTNPHQVLRPETVRRLHIALDSDTAIAVVSAAEVAAGEATAAGEDGALTWSFHADSVRDFAFATSKKYVWDAAGADTGGELGRVRIDALYDPTLRHWKKAVEYAKHSIEFYSDYILPYPYSHASVAYAPPWVGGMEYPMIVFINRSAPGEPLYSVVTHELSHEWFPMVVGSKEMAYAWMDEGFTTFDESLSREDYYGNENARLQDRRYYLQAARAGVEAPLMEPTDYVDNEFGRGVAAYMKPGTLMYALRTIMGKETFDKAYASYARAWAFKHPLPWDFFQMMETAVGTDLDWFWRPWFYETVQLDQAIENVEPKRGALEITLSNRKGAVMPVLLEIEMTDSSTRRVSWPADVWAGTRRITRTIPLTGQVRRIVIDPDESFPDIDRTNNQWRSRN